MSRGGLWYATRESRGGFKGRPVNRVPTHFYDGAKQTKQIKTKQDRKREDKTKQNETKQNKTKQVSISVFFQSLVREKRLQL